MVILTGYQPEEIKLMTQHKIASQLRSLSASNIETLSDFMHRKQITQYQLAHLLNMKQPNLSVILKKNQYLILNGKTIVKIIKEL